MTPERWVRRTLRPLTSLCLLLFLAAAPLQAQEPAAVPGASLEVALLTFGPGTEVWERFGHNAILIQDRTRGQALLYNYGIFDFAQENFFLNFARGRMQYRIAVGDPADELPMYVAEGRWIVRQDLNLVPAQRQRLAELLARNARPENAQYRYDYFTANCSTRVRDALDIAVDGAIKQQTVAPSRGFTYRMEAMRLMRPEPLLMLGMDAGLGPFADQRLSYWDESFIPMEFMRRIRDVRVVDASGNSQPLVMRETRLAEARVAEPAEFPPDWIWQALAVGVGSGLLLAALARARRRAGARVVFALLSGFLALVLGLGGLVLIALWTMTDHVSAWRNENLLLWNPLCLLLLPTWVRAFRADWRPTLFAHRVALVVALLAGLAFFLKVFPEFAQDNRFWIALLLPVHVALAASIHQAGNRANRFSTRVGAQ
jgi:Domain of unknown function (DUF4105)